MRVVFFFLLALGLRAQDIVYSTITGTPTQSINYINYEVGCRFINFSGVDVVITEVARWKKTGNTQSHTVSVYSSSNVLLQSVAVNMAGAPNEAFVFGALPAVVTVAPGDSVWILSAETTGVGADTLWGTSVNTPEDIGGMYPGWRQSGVLSSAFPNNSTQSFGPVTFKYSAPVPSWSYDEGTNTYTTDGTFYQVKSALAASNDTGGTVVMPAGTFDFFEGGATMSIPSGVALTGDDKATTIVNMSTASVTGFNNASITLNEGSILKKMTINGPNVANAVPILTATGAGTWRVTEVKYQQYLNRSSYFINIQRAPSGRIDHCDLFESSGTSELIFSRGPDPAWQNPPGMGDANAVYVEDCTFNGPNQGYCNDANSNGKIVFRFNTITGRQKVDGHGLASNGAPTPTNRGVRRMEVYNNRWTSLTSGGWTAMELRGGTPYVFNNSSDLVGAGAVIQLRDYGYVGMAAGFRFRFQTPQNYPLLDQVGTGMDTVVNATDIGLGDYVQINEVGTTNFVDFGAASNTPGIWFFATGTPTGSGTVITNGPATPGFIFGNKKNGAAWARTSNAVPSGSTFITNTAGYAAGSTSITLATIPTNIYATNAIAFTGDINRYLITNSPTNPGPKALTIASPGLVQPIAASAVNAAINANTLWQQQQGSSSATFLETDIVRSGRDFKSDLGFDANTNVMVGTVEQMALATPTTGNGFWVTNEGSWNHKFVGTVAAASLGLNYFCEIVALGDTNWQAIGAPSGAVVGTQFTATGAGSGTGTAKPAHGQLYVGNGTSWVLTYTPYTYPFDPVPPPTPVLVSSTTDATGNFLSLNLSVSCSTGAGGNGGVTINASGGPVSWMYSSGEGSMTYTGILSRTIIAAEVVSVSYAQPGDGIESTADQIDLESFTDQPVTNGSTVNTTQAKTLRNSANMGGGF